MRNNKLFALLIVLTGCLFRASQYLSERSLWLDEIKLADNLLTRGFHGLVGALDHNAAAPIGFLVIEKSATILLGQSDFVLRLFPFVCGIFALLAFALFAIRQLGWNKALLPIAIFTVSDTLIYYSSELKQYSSDVLCALILYICLSSRWGDKSNRNHTLVLACVGSILVWFSHPIIFVMASAGTIMLALSFLKKSKPMFFEALFINVAWVVSFIICYKLTLVNHEQNSHLKEVWAFGFAPFPLSSGEELLWYIKSFVRLFNNPVGLPRILYPLTVSFFLIGLYQSLRQSLVRTLMLISPLIIGLICSLFQLYPFTGRLLLFSVPSLIFILGEGMNSAGALKQKMAKGIAFTAIFMVIAIPTTEAILHLGSFRQIEEARPLIEILKQSAKEKDSIYIYYAAKGAFDYYARNSNFSKAEVVYGISSREKPKLYNEDIGKLKGNARVWVLFSHIYNWNDIDEEEYFLEELNNLGIKLQSHKHTGASLYLYNLENEL
jgi:hypothetical protein